MHHIYDGAGNLIDTVEQPKSKHAIVTYDLYRPKLVGSSFHIHVRAVNKYGESKAADVRLLLRLGDHHHKPTEPKKP